MKKILLSPDAAPAAAAPAAKPAAAPGKLTKVKALSALAEDHNGTTHRHVKGDVFEVNDSRLASLKGLVEVVKLVLLLALLGFGSLAAQAQQISSQYLGPFIGSNAAQSTILASMATNLSAVNTNSAASNNVVTLTTYKSFELEIAWKPSNDVSNAPAIRWSSSMDGINWPVNSGATNAQNASWFSIIAANVTNSAGVAYWHTNVTVNANYWRLEWITNGAASALSNVMVRATKKPSSLGQ